MHGPAMRNQRGTTLIEAMVAMCVLLVGALGLLGLNNLGARMNNDGRRMMRATAVAQDLLNQLQSWSYDDPRLANTVRGNDGDIADGALAFEAAVPPASDHGEADLTPATFNGIDAAELAPMGIQRFWNVSENDDGNGNGVPDAKRIAVIVRWPQSTGFRRIVLLSSRPNPGDAQ